MVGHPILYDTHMHTVLCKHAKGEPDDYANQAQKRGLKGLIFTCHNPTENDEYAPSVRMRVDQLETYVGLVEAAQQHWAGQVDIRLGLESDYIPGMESWLEHLHARAPFEYILGSVHPQLAEYKALYLNGDPAAFQRTYFEHLALAAETGLFDCLAHPDIVKIIFPTTWRVEQLMDDIQRALDRIARTGVAMELNTSGLHKSVQEMNPARPILLAMHERNIPVVVGSDSHEPGRVGADFEQAFDLLSWVGYESVSVFLERQRHDIRIAEARTSLSAPATTT